ncbi:ComEC/Rec2 family competence protein [Nonomuraea typhae]|uniref:ComEC/Rec2 family competence protein n=1 Tax=Nonomuraea typhae TaxID=2603600 RepID=UPI0015E231CE|nr:ComEC/Rec2 family competence protein [Nonomuraea typhae]
MAPAHSTTSKPGSASDLLRSLTLPAIATWLTALTLLPAPAAVNFTIAAAAALTTAALFRTPRTTALSITTCVAATAATVGFHTHAVTTGPVPALAREGATATAEVVLTADPKIRAANRFPTESVVAEARLELLETRSQRLPARVPVLVFATGPAWRQLLPSQRIRITARLTTPGPGTLTAAILLAKGTPTLLGTPSPLQTAANAPRAGLRTAAAPLPPEERGLLPALVVGDTTHMRPEVTADFKTAGLTHLTAVSGANLAIIAGAALALSRLAGLPLPMRAALAATAMIAFAVVARPSPSVLRALMMGLLAALALATGRTRDGMTALSASVLLLILFSPDLARSWGFALSVTATAGILVLAPKWRNHLTRHPTPGTPPSDSTPPKPPQSQPTHPQPIRPKPTDSQTTDSQTVRPKPTHEPTHPEPTHPEPTHPEPTHPEPTHPEPTHPEPTHPKTTNSQSGHSQVGHSPGGESQSGHPQIGGSQIGGSQGAQSQSGHFKTTRAATWEGTLTQAALPEPHPRRSHPVTRLTRHPGGIPTALQRLIPKRRPPKRLGPRGRGLPGWLAEAIAVPAAAQVAVTPLLVLMSGQITPIAVIANLLAGPAVAPATVLGFAASLVAPFSLEAAQILTIPAGYAVGWIITVSRWAADIPFASIPWPGGFLGLTLLAATAALAIALLRHPQSRAITMATLAGILVAATTLPPIISPWPPRRWLLVMCDVGQGDGMAIAAGPGRAVVVDTGPDPTPINRCLRDLNIQEIPLLILTHPHADHTAGLEGAIEARKVTRAILTPPTPAPLAHTLRTHNIPTQAPVPGTQWRLGPSELTILAPPESPTRTTAPTHAGEINNSSVVIRVRWQAGSILLSGDIETEAQSALLQTIAPTADILKVPHHGSARQDPAFIAAIGARAALISVGADNDYGHPAPATLSLLHRNGTRIYRTDQSGDLAITDHNTTLAITPRH